MITLREVKEIKAEMLRMSRALNAYEHAMVNAKDSTGRMEGWGTKYGVAGKESGALRRASLDLTRALAELRKA